MHDFHNFNNAVRGIQHKIVEMALEVGVEEVGQSDGQEVLAVRC
jgi:hypothetical protein